VLARQRWEAKQSKDWASADALRNQISDKGWTVKDRKDGFDLIPNE
jgi:cysteinyl-tRNA synthetase